MTFRRAVGGSQCTCGGTADTLDLGSSAARRVGSSPTRCTTPALLGVVLYLDFRRGERIQEQKLAGVCRYAAGCGWRLVVCSERRSRRSNLSSLLARFRPVGCIVEGSTEHGPVSRAVLNGLPTVYMDGRHVSTGRRTGAVFVDGAAVAATAFAELRANRPTAFGVVGYRVRRKWSDERMLAFSSVVSASGGRLFKIGSGPDDVASRRKRLAGWISGLPKRAAVFAVNDETALEVVAAARSVGRAIPRDFTLLGVDNMESECESSEPKLSSIQLDFDRAGYKAAEMLEAMVRGASAGTERVRVSPLQTVRRESTRGFGRYEPRVLKVLETIRRESCNGLRARDVVKMMCGSRRLTELRFREAFGHSILDEINLVRMDRVFQMLRDPCVPLPLVIDRSGFPSPRALRKGSST